MMLAVAAVLTASAIDVTPDNNRVTQNFDSMYDGTAATLAMPEGWRVERNLSAPRNVGAWSAASAEVMYSGGVSLASNAKNGTYNFGNNTDLVGYENIMQQFFNGGIDYNEVMKQTRELETMNTDWFDILCHNSFSHDHSVSISGGSERVRYYTSVGYTDQDDVINSTTNRRYTAMSKIDMDLSQKFKLQFNVNGYLNKRQYAQDDNNPVDYAYNTSEQQWVNANNTMTELGRGYLKRTDSETPATMTVDYKTDYGVMVFNTPITSHNCDDVLGDGTVSIYCLEQFDDMPTVPEEKNAGIEDGVQINNGWGPKRILGENGKVTGVEFKRGLRVRDVKIFYRYVGNVDEAMSAEVQHETAV